MLALIGCLHITSLSQGPQKKLSSEREAFSNRFLQDGFLHYSLFPDEMRKRILETNESWERCDPLQILYPHQHFQHASLLSALKRLQTFVQRIASTDQGLHIDQFLAEGTQRGGKGTTARSL
jgi:hypothetical protein